MIKATRAPQQAVQESHPRNVSIAEILRKGNLSVSDPGPVTPPTAQISTTPPKSASGNASSSSAQRDGKK